MSQNSSSMTYEQTKAMLDIIRDGAFPSRRDGCIVTLVKCVECSRMFEEELEVAKTKVLSNQALLCLACDEDATVPGFSGVTVQIGWWR